jgi:hypothetical protein
MTLCDREASSEERGTETNSFNGVFGARLGLAFFLRRPLQELKFAARSKAQTPCLAPEGSPLDRPHAVESRCGAVV